MSWHSLNVQKTTLLFNKNQKWFCFLFFLLLFFFEIIICCVYLFFTNFVIRPIYVMCGIFFNVICLFDFCYTVFATSIYIINNLFEIIICFVCLFVVENVNFLDFKKPDGHCWNGFWSPKTDSFKFLRPRFCVYHYCTIVSVKNVVIW